MSMSMINKTTLFLLDNVDSFTYNLVDELRALNLEINVYRNTVCADMLFEKMQEQATKGPVLLMLSPGPGAPSEAGCMPALLEKVAGTFPVLGICLGHQAIVEYYGGIVGRATQVMHGKSSAITHSEKDMFTDLPQPLHVARYHSLAAQTLPDALEPCASCVNDDGSETVMAVFNKTDKMLGFQFHPESILTAQGSVLLKQSIDYLTQQG
ncbi:aminodeoxychorismate/anthranilate synthase component II [Alteromonas stellipolaris]|uniref:anthranilate synthase n=1 Tax=Alteromonas stellipolaris TaxID=233316 RepID=A0ABN4LJL7_9ALTE|nr:aminodeoxychorismate/anthranilate synthase component II [Alteromonas stellipolaris]ALM91143.1 Anthranilate synthase, amidotransferase component [Alteromonas stellipolaris LMG 21856]AMJ74149.1 anthranilate synthase subunit II [Alteromonas stellipolaris]